VQDTSLQDGARQKPSYNLRTLSRALGYARAAAPLYGLQRGLYDGFAVGFLTQLCPESGPRLEAALLRHLLPGVKSVKVRQGAADGACGCGCVCVCVAEAAEAAEVAALPSSTATSTCPQRSPQPTGPGRQGWPANTHRHPGNTLATHPTPPLNP
jgi:hypothetical protein